MQSAETVLDVLRERGRRQKNAVLRDREPIPQPAATRS